MSSNRIEQIEDQPQQPAAAQTHPTSPLAVSEKRPTEPAGFEEFDLDDIEVIESKVFA